MKRLKIVVEHSNMCWEALILISLFAVFALLILFPNYEIIPNMKAYLSAAGFGKMIGKDPKTIRRWIDQGLIPTARKMGGHYQVPIEEVEKATTLKQYPPEEVWQR
jgi:hypothetical protein